jgi:hypothetical protein
VKKLHRQHPVTHQRMSLRQIAAEMAKLGMLSRNGKPYSAAGIKLLLERK